MTDETSNTAVPTEAAKPAKKPYVKPQLHVLTGDHADGKSANPGELGINYGPS